MSWLSFASVADCDTGLARAALMSCPLADIGHRSASYGPRRSGCDRRGAACRGGLLPAATESLNAGTALRFQAGLADHGDEADETLTAAGDGGGSAAPQPQTTKMARCSGRGQASPRKKATTRPGPRLLEGTAPRPALSVAPTKREGGPRRPAASEARPWPGPLGRPFARRGFSRRGRLTGGLGVVSRHVPHVPPMWSGQNYPAGKLVRSWNGLIPPEPRPPG